VPQRQPVQVAYVAPPKPATVQRTPPVQEAKIWLQLASGDDADALSDQFYRIKSRNRDLFKGINGYVDKGSDRARLLIGPFRGSSDADIFADDLQSVGVDAFKWTNSASDRIVPLASE
jgi:cell division protein FtsN